VGTGAGEEMRRAMGIAVFWGMVGVTSFGIFLTPVFYVLLRTLATRRPAVKVQPAREGVGGAPFGMQPQGRRDD